MPQKIFNPPLPSSQDWASGVLLFHVSVVCLVWVGEVGYWSSAFASVLHVHTSFFHV